MTWLKPCLLQSGLVIAWLLPSSRTLESDYSLTGEEGECHLGCAYIHSLGYEHGIALSDLEFGSAEQHDFPGLTGLSGAMGLGGSRKLVQFL